MPMIDADGMFSGDRMALLSDGARLYWPWFYLASNGMGRMELNYHRISHQVFANFDNPPSEETFWTLMREYHARFLLFVYQADGKIWGQWDTSEKYLPKYKLSKDLQTPAPPHEKWISWKNAYAATKTAQVPLLATFSETFQNFSKLSEKFPVVVVDAVVVGEVKVHKAAAAVESSSLVATETSEPKQAAAARNGSKPTAPRNPEPFDEKKPELGQLAWVLIDDLSKQHPTPGPLHYAIHAVERILREAVDPVAIVESCRKTHAAMCVYWAKQRKHRPNGFIPQLHRWFTDGDYLHGPVESRPPVSSINRRLEEAEKREALARQNGSGK